MYYIMVVKSARSNYGSLYQFMTSTVDGEVGLLEIETKDALDARIEKMLNTGGYSKNDFIVVELIDYTIDATDYTDEEDEEEDTEESTDDTEEASDDEDSTDSTNSTDDDDTDSDTTDETTTE